MSQSAVASHFAELIITPDLELLAEIAHDGETTLTRHPLFRSRSRRIDYGLQRRRTEFLHEMRCDHLGDVEVEERVVDLLRHAMRQPAPQRAASPQSRRLIARTKAFLESNLSRPVRLADVAQGVGGSPAYLTDLFRRIEGVPLHGYLTQLRVARALVELPHTADHHARARAGLLEPQSLHCRVPPRLRLHALVVSRIDATAEARPLGDTPHRLTSKFCNSTAVASRPYCEQE